MAESEVALVNSALVKIGEDTITSLNEDRKAARTAKRQYPVRRRALIRRYRWNFAMARIVLAPEGTGAKFGFTNRFLQPVDSVRVVGLFDENEPQANYTSSRIPYKVEGRFILADDDTLNLFFLRDVTDTTQWDPLFDEAFAWYLAIDFSFVLSASRKVREDAARGFDNSIKDAKRADVIEGTPEIVQSSEWLDARAPGGFPRIGPVVF